MSAEMDTESSLEEEVFKTLSHQVRRDILRFVGEIRSAKFTEIKKAVGIDESPSLSYHLNSLSPLISHDNDVYKLSDIGQDAYALMTRIVTSSDSAAILQQIGRRLGPAIIANAVLWGLLGVYMNLVEGPLQFITSAIFIVCFTMSNTVLYYVALHKKHR